MQAQDISGSIAGTILDPSGAVVPHAKITFTNTGRRSNGHVSVAYTWARNMTDSLSDRSNAPQNSYDFHDSEYGPARLDRRQVLTSSYWYKLPGPRHGNRALVLVAGGWEVSGNTQYGTGLPYTVCTSGVDPGGLGILGSSAASPRPTRSATRIRTRRTHTARRADGRLLVQQGLFANVVQGVVRPGNAGRDTVRGPGYGKWDLSLFKNVSIHERWKLQLRGESFNFLNHTASRTHCSDALRRSAIQGWCS
jgi:hypothetical protein